MHTGLFHEIDFAAQGKSLSPDWLTEKSLAALRGLNQIAEARGQSLAQMAIAWVLRGGRVTSALIGASRPEQVVECAGAIANTAFTPDELARVTCPIGIPGIGGKEPEVIAVAVAAQLLQTLD